MWKNITFRSAVAAKADAASANFAQQLRQLRDVRRNPPRLILTRRREATDGHWPYRMRSVSAEPVNKRSLGKSSPPRLPVAHPATLARQGRHRDKAGVTPRQTTAAGSGGRGGRWFAPQAIESVTERARSAAARKRGRRRHGSLHRALKRHGIIENPGIDGGCASALIAVVLAIICKDAG
jgi:hypothetical protein